MLLHRFPVSTRPRRPVADRQRRHGIGEHVPSADLHDEIEAIPALHDTR